MSWSIHAVFFAGLLLLSSLAHAALAANQVASAQYYITENQSISITTGQMTNLTLNITVPADAKIVSMPPGATLVSDEDGNARLEVFEARPSMPYALFVNMTVQSNQSLITGLPLQWATPSQFSKYLKSSDAVPAADPKYRALALNITRNATTPFSKLAALAQWVNAYITYDPSYVSRSPGANEILDERRGVCTEYATLFATLSRSMGYPTRFVNGYAYSDEYSSWLGHAWTEAYVGKWVPVDPTWMEVGRLDGTHIVSSRQSEQDFRFASVSALVYPPSADIVWEGASSRGVLADNVHMLSSQSMEPSENFTFGVSAPILPANATFIVYLRYPASDYHLLRASLATCISARNERIATLPSQVMNVVSEPGATINVLWLGRTGSDLEQDVQYSCPLTLNSNYLAMATLPLNITSDAKLSWPVLNATLRSDTISAGKNQSVFVLLPKSMAGRPLTGIEEDVFVSGQVGEDGSAHLEFLPSRLGEHTLYVFSSLGDPQILHYGVIPAADFELSEPAADRPLVQGEPNRLLMHFISVPASNLSASRLDWALGAQTGSITLPPSGQDIQVPLTPLSSGQMVFSASVIGPNNGVLARSSWPLGISKPSSVSVSVEKMLALPDGQWQVHVLANRSGPIQGPAMLLVDGRAFSIPDDGRLAFNVKPGSHDSALVWHNGLGQEKRLKWNLDVSGTESQPQLDFLSSLLLDSTTLLVIAISLFVLAVLVFGAGLYLSIQRQKARDEAALAPKPAQNDDNAEQAGFS